VTQSVAERGGFGKARLLQAADVDETTRASNWCPPLAGIRLIVSSEILKACSIPMKAAVDAAHIAVAAVHRMDILRGVFPATLFR